MEGSGSGNGGKRRRGRPGKVSMTVPHPLAWDKMSPLEARFVDALLADSGVSAREAALRAGVAPDRAEEWGKLLMRRRNVRKALGQVKSALTEELALDRARVLREQCRVAFSDPRGLPGFPEGVDEVAAAAVSGFEVTTVTMTGKDGTVTVTERRKFSLWNKGAALDALMRHLGMFREDNEQSRPVVQVANIDLSDFSRQELEALAKLGIAGQACVEGDGRPAPKLPPPRFDG